MSVSSAEGRSVWPSANDKGRKPFTPGGKSRGKPIKHDNRRHKRRNRIKIMFGRLKEWRRAASGDGNRHASQPAVA